MIVDFVKKYDTISDYFCFMLGLSFEEPWDSGEYTLDGSLWRVVVVVIKQQTVRVEMNLVIICLT